MLLSNVTQKTISHFKLHRDWYKTNDTYQREQVWSKQDKQYLIDSIIKQFPIPQIFINKKSSIDLEIVDGQQRMTAIWDFINNKFPLLAEYSGSTLGGKYYRELPSETQVEFDSFSINMVILENYDDGAIRSLFRRLQAGKPLTPGEKLNAFPGTITLIMREIALHPLFKKLPFTLHRYRSYQLTGILFKIAEEGITNVGAPHIYNFFDHHKNANEKSIFYKRTKKVLNLMNKIIIDDKFPEMSKPAWFVNFFTFTMELQENYVINGMEKNIYNFFKYFFDYIESSKNATGAVSPEIVKFIDYNKAGTNNKKNIKERLKLMMIKFLERYPDIILKDETRQFNEYQRIAIYRRDNGKCQNPNCPDRGIKIPWNDYHADHKKPYEKGGSTIVSNGQTLCSKCNLAKSSNMDIGY